MNDGPIVEQIECPWCPCEQPGPWVARCCGRQLGNPGKNAHLARYFHERTDAWLHLANHLRSEHSIEPPPMPTGPAEQWDPYAPAVEDADPTPTLFDLLDATP